MIGVAVLKLVGEEVIKKLTETAFQQIKKIPSGSTTANYKKIIANFPELYESHLNEIINWAYSIPFIGLSRPKETINTTIELLIASDIYKKDDGDIKVTESDLLNSEENILLVGGPGAGKTTTLKRLIIKYINSNDENAYGFPILIRLRDIGPDTNLSKTILNILGISFEDREVVTLQKRRRVKKNKLSGKKGEIVEDVVRKKSQMTFVGDISAKMFLSKLLNETRCILLLDGLDEIDRSIKNNILKEIQEISLKLSQSKVIVTIRKSELDKIIDGFTQYEISPLSQVQIENIANKWMKNSADFLNEINYKPYKDLANRPVFLTLLMILFEKNRNLPSQPSEVYEDATYLIIKEWDEHRDIYRGSKYADFNSRKKIKFLSEVSYCLTYKIKQKSFSSADLKEIYLSICSKYELPEEEMNMVIAEVESHTGIIIESGYRNYEFAHLSIQEFLCAKHILTLPYSKETLRYFREYPEPLAIAVCISGEPSIWLANLLLNSSLNINNFKSEKDQKIYLSRLYTLLNRLVIENPSFKITTELGMSMLYLITNLNDLRTFDDILEQLVRYKAVKESFAIALNNFDYTISYTSSETKFLLSKKTPTQTDALIVIPYMGVIPCKYIDILSENGLITLDKGKIKAQIQLLN